MFAGLSDCFDPIDRYILNNLVNLVLNHAICMFQTLLFKIDLNMRTSARMKVCIPFLFNAKRNICIFQIVDYIFLPRVSTLILNNGFLGFKGGGVNLKEQKLRQMKGG